MSLSPKAARVLAEVKMGLSVLYGAEYFTEEEWIKIDCLIHKGAYVFTHGPPTNLLEEPLMSFDESREDKDLVYQIQETEIVPSMQEITVESEEKASPPPSSTGDFINPPTATTNETSGESSSDGEASAQPSSSVPQMFDFSKATTPLSSAPAEQPKTNGLPPGCTQEQLDEVRAFNAGLTKAGHKTRPKYTSIDASVEDYPPSSWTEDAAETTKQTAFSSPAPTEREARISSWASEVDAADPDSPNIIAPKPEAAKLKEVLAEEFIKIHGRKPKSINDFYQPNNPEYHRSTKRPESRAGSVKTVTSTLKFTPKAILQRPSSVAPSSGGKAPILPKLDVKHGTIIKAQQGSIASSKTGLDVQAGDHIKVGKHVSGIMHIGQNMRTKLMGQFPETIFRSPPGGVAETLIDQQRNLAERKADAPKTIDEMMQAGQMEAARRHLDEVEKRNAMEWDEPIRRPMTTAPTASAPLRHTGGGLAASRFSVLEEPTVQSDVKDITREMYKEFGKLVDTKFDAILKLHGMAPTPQPQAQPQPKIPTKPSSKSFKDPVKPAPIKSEVCWFWSKSKDGCRFTAEECMNAHEYLPTAPSITTGIPSNLRNGKPTWGAAADYENNADKEPRYKTKTCYYWAIEGKCVNSAEECRYLHEHSSAGIAARPTWKLPPKPWSLDSWKKSDVAEEAEEGELVLEEVKDEGSTWGEPLWAEPSGQTSGWGESPTVETSGGSSWGDDKYKPPHVVALENKMRQQAIGW